MAEGARARFGADWAIAVTGIAGPTGGTPTKPVGLVFIAVAGPDGTRVIRNQFSGEREDIKRKTAEEALHLLLERIT
jgi:nicotinamide-nucleotide amidase